MAAQNARGTGPKTPQTNHLLSTPALLSWRVRLLLFGTLKFSRTRASGVGSALRWDQCAMARSEIHESGLSHGRIRILLNFNSTGTGTAVRSFRVSNEDPDSHRLKLDESLIHCS